jgi:hypothetical protein
LVDILAQNPREFDLDYVAAGLRKVREFLPLVTPQMREQCVRSLFGRIQSPPLVLLLAGDIPSVASAAISGAKLSDAEWAEIIPALPTRARGFLRNRSDLGPETRRAHNATRPPTHAVTLRRHGRRACGTRGRAHRVTPGPPAAAWSSVRE